MRLTDELRKEHSDIIVALERARELSISTPEGRSKLISAKEELLAHLEKEDKCLYPVLSKAKETNEALKLIMDNFELEMEKVTRTAINFFNSYLGGEQYTSFDQEFLNFYSLLRARVRTEEKILFKEYEKLNI